MEQEELNSERPIISMSQTAGLTSIGQLIDSTSDEIFSFKDTTSGTEETFVIPLPSYREQKQAVEE